MRDTNSNNILLLIFVFGRLQLSVMDESELFISVREQSISPVGQQVSNGLLIDKTGTSAMMSRFDRPNSTAATSGGRSI